MVATLDLNEAHEYVIIENYQRPFYRAFSGRYVEEAPRIKRKGLIIASVSDILERRLQSTKKDWKTNYFNTGDAVIFPTYKDKFKVSRSNPFLRNIHPKSRFSSGALVLADDVYADIDGAEFSRKDLKSVLGCVLTLANVKQHPIWQYLASDQALLDEYATRMFSEMKTEYGYDYAMGIYLADAQKVPTAQALVVDGLGSRSLLDGGGDLVDDDGRLVGLVPEARHPRRAV